MDDCQSKCRRFFCGPKPSVFGLPRYECCYLCNVRVRVAQRVMESEIISDKEEGGHRVQNEKEE